MEGRALGIGANLWGARLDGWPGAGVGVTSLAGPRRCPLFAKKRLGLGDVAARGFFQRAAKPAGRNPCWSPRWDRAESRGSKLPCGRLDGMRKPSSARLRPGRARGSGMFKGCQSLVER